MGRSLITIDGIPYDLRIPKKGIQRTFQIVDTDKAGRLISGDMQRDVIGTYYNYSVSFITDTLTREEYDRFYEVISAPEDYHIITLPYGQTVITYKAYITEGTDQLEIIDSLGNKWNGIKINFIAMSPARRATE